MHGNNGIQELLSAEKRASEIVAEARTGRGEKMKGARAEAQEVINQFNAEKETAFLSSNVSAGGDSASQTQALKQGTQQEMNLMQGSFDANKQEALKILVTKVGQVNLDVSKARIRSAQKAAAGL